MCVFVVCCLFVVCLLFVCIIGCCVCLSFAYISVFVAVAVVWMCFRNSHDRFVILMISKRVCLSLCLVLCLCVCVCVSLCLFVFLCVSVCASVCVCACVCALSRQAWYGHFARRAVCVSVWVQAQATCVAACDSMANLFVVVCMFAASYVFSGDMLVYVWFSLSFLCGSPKFYLTR